MLAVWEILYKVKISVSVMSLSFFHSFCTVSHMASSRKFSRPNKPARRPLDDEFTWDSFGPLSANLTRMSTDLAQFARPPSPTLPAQPDALVTSPKDDPGPKGNNVASPPTAIDAGFVSTTTLEDQVNSAPRNQVRI